MTITLESLDAQLAAESERHFDAGNEAMLVDDVGAATGHLGRAAELGHVPAMATLGALLKNTGHGELGLAWIAKAAERGDPYAQYNLGLHYHESGDQALAHRWWSEAASSRESDVAALAYNGLGVIGKRAGDRATATNNWVKAAQLGEPHAASSLALYALDQNEWDGAYYWFRQSAKAGHTASMFNLALMLEEAGDDEQAERWYGQAADLGHPRAGANLRALRRQRRKGRLWRR